MDNWIFPNPEYPGKIEMAVHVDLDSRKPLRKDQAEALDTEVERLIKARDELGDRIRKINRRRLLSDNSEGDRGKK